MRSDVEDVLKRIQDWSMEDLERLCEELKILIRQRRSAEPLYDVRDFEGIGHGTWAGVNIDEYIRQERASWDEYEKRLEEDRNS